jgi:hypothetical protein
MAYALTVALLSACAGAVLLGLVAWACRLGVPPPR